MSAADIDAINDYINRTTAITAPANDDRNEWISFYKGLSIFDKMSDDTLKKAYGIRDKFNTDNKTPSIPSVPLTAEESSYFLNMPVVDTTGMSAKEAQEAVWKAPISPIAVPTSLLPVGQKQSSTKQIGPLMNYQTVTGATIKQGNTGDDVKVWQSIVGVPITGTFDATTTAATKVWQKKYGLTADGIVGPKTWNKAVAETADVKMTPTTPSTGGTPVTPAKVAVTPVNIKPVTPVTPKPPIIEAGFFSFLNNIPTWAKWGLGLIFAGGIGYGLSKDKKKSISEHKRLMAEDDEYYTRMTQGSNPNRRY